MSEKITILHGYSNMEKGAYLGAIASLATADRIASEEELEYIEALIASADINNEQAALIRHAATTDIADEDLKRFLDELKSSELRFSLLSDVIAFANSDKNYTEDEEQKVKAIADYMGVNNDQLSILNQFTQKAVETAPQQAEELTSENKTPAGFFKSLGFGDKLKNAGINTSSLFKGALGIIGPLLLAKMFSGGNRDRSSTGRGLLGGLFGSGGGGGLLGNLMGSSSGGLLGGLLGGGRGFGNAGGLLGRIFGP
ncbi:MAG: TerB family tellurite resistance protein [Ferruginibacter sp.]